MKKRKRRQLTNKKKRLIIINVFLAVFLFLGVGYSALSANLNIIGQITVKEQSEPTSVYNLFRNMAINPSDPSNPLVEEYTGTHDDSPTDDGKKKIYYFTADNTTEANEVLDMNNVIFAGFCWQMIRTTDTGGVKMIYNGVPVEGKCNNSGEAQQIGKTAFNTSSNSPSYSGYMYNKVYNSGKKDPLVNNILGRSSMTNSSKYYYGVDVSYDEENNKYNLIDVTQDTWSNVYSSATGLYTCRSTSNTSCSVVYYIAGGKSNYMYGFTMTGGKMLDYYNTNISFGTGYTNSDGIYTLTNSTTITKAEFFQNPNSYKNLYTCGDQRTECTDMQYVIRVNSNYVSDNYYNYEYILVRNNYIYSDSFVYDESTGIYTLSDNRVQFWDISQSSNSTKLNSHHYTCFNQTGECTTLSYISYVYGSSIYYINLNGGVDIIEAKDEMLYGNNVNNTNSNIKSFIDNWYEENLIDYTDYLEDIVFCNDRYQTNASTNGLNPNGGRVDRVVYFNGSTDLTCLNETDRFSVSNPKAKLTYPIGLMSYNEMDLLGNNLLRKTGTSYWLGTPYEYLATAPYVYLVESDGTMYYSITYPTPGVRPAISLKSSIKYLAGDGSKNNPFIVGGTFNITCDDPEVSITDTGINGMRYQLISDGYTIVSFKLNGQTIEGDSFIMPNGDAEITDVTKGTSIIVESEHNPYPNSLNNVVYYENTFEGALYLNVQLTYQTEGANYDWVYLYNEENGEPFNNRKFTGTTKKTETLTLPNNYLKIVFKTNVNTNNYYGFKAIITPIY